MGPWLYFWGQCIGLQFFLGYWPTPSIKKKVNLEREVICYSINLDICISKFVVIRCVT